MHPFQEHVQNITRRYFFQQGSHAIGWAALASLLGKDGLGLGGAAFAAEKKAEVAPGPHFAPKAKHVIYLHMVGGPPQMDLYDYKPAMKEWYDKDLPQSVRMGQRLTTMTSGQAPVPHRPEHVQFSEARRKRHVGVGPSAIYGEDGRPDVLHSLDAHRGDQP